MRLWADVPLEERVRIPTARNGDTTWDADDRPHDGCQAAVRYGARWRRCDGLPAEGADICEWHVPKPRAYPCSEGCLLCISEARGREAVAP